MRFPYTLVGTTRSLAPYLSLRLFNGENTVAVTGLVDSGAALNVLPYDIGLSLGAVWEEQTTVIPLAGNLAAFEARALVIRAQIAELPTSVVTLAFAWSQNPNIPIILGQVNFFLEFNVCFYRAQQVFDVTPRTS